MKTLWRSGVRAGLLVGALLLAACGSVPLAQTVQPTPLPTVTRSEGLSIEGRLVPLRSAALTFASGGEIAEIPVSEGQDVSQGAVLMRLGKREVLEAALKQAQVEQVAAEQALDDLRETADLARAQAGQSLVEAQRVLTEAQKAYNDLNTDDFTADLDDRRAEMEDARTELEDAQEELDKFKDLDPDHTRRKTAQDALDDAQDAYDDAVYEFDILENQLDQAQAAVELAQAQVDDAQREADARASGPDPDDLALAQARAVNAAAQVAAAQRALENMDLTAPYAGTVVDLYDYEPGEMVVAGRTVVTLADESAWLVETRDLTELDVVEVQAGQAVLVTPDALPDLELAGEVESVDRVFTERSGDILYTVRVRLTDGDPRLRWGMTVTVAFEP